MVSPEEILNFWLDETGPEGWYGGGEALDQEIRDRFGAAWEAAMDGAYGLWLTYPSGALAYLILTDQFPRNMFRGDTVFQSGRIVIQQIVSPVDSLDGLSGNVEVQVWGTEQGGALVAEVLVYREIT